LDLLKNKFSVGIYCNSNNGDFEEMVGRKKIKKKCTGCVI
jgi:hypothetical protein